MHLLIFVNRGGFNGLVAQPGRACALQARGRGFKSHRGPQL